MPMLPDRPVSPGVPAPCGWFMVTSSSLRDFRMSSSRAVVASFKPMRSVALSLLRLLSCVMSFCKLDTMVVMLSNEFEMASNVGAGAGAGDCGVRTGDGDGGLVTLGSGGSRCSRGIVMFCSASMVAEGGVFSPSIAFWRDRVDGRRAGVSFKISRLPGVGVPIREGL